MQVTSLTNWVQIKMALSLRKYFSNIIMQSWINIDSVELGILHRDLIKLLTILRKHTYYKFKVLSDITVYDCLQNSRWVYIVYNLLSVRFNCRIFIITMSTKNEFIPSTVSVYSNANWIEREIWDLFGIFFVGHGDLRRILTDYGFSGHPLRKDFPLTGFNEVFYDRRVQRIRSKPIGLVQELRGLQGGNPWM